MSNFIFAPLFGAIANLIVAVFVFTRAPTHRLNRVYLGWGLALSVWCLGAGALFFVKTEGTAYDIAQLLQYGVIMIPATALHVCLLMADAADEVNMRRFLGLCYVISLALVLANLFNLYIRGVQRVDYGWFARAGYGFWVFTAFMPCATLPGVIALLRRRRHVEPDQRRKFTILIAANILLLASGTHDIAPVLGWFKYPGSNVTIYPWGTYVAGFYGLMVAYGVLQDQILDVRVTLSRYAAYIVRLGFLGSLVLLLLIVVGTFAPPGGLPRFAFLASLAVMMIAAVITGWLFPKVFGGVSEGLERKLLGDRFEYQEQIVALANSVHRHTRVDEMWQEVAEILAEAMKLSPVQCLILGARKFSKPFHNTVPREHPTASVLGSFGADCPLVLYLSENHAVMDVHAAISPWEEAAKRDAHEQAKKLGAEYIFPLQGTERLLGFIAIGKKRNNAPMTALDIELLQQLSQRFAWATERTLLAERVGFAEKHELLALMARGLAHDLNNLLTPVSTILQLTSRAVQHGSPEEHLFEAAESSLRAVRNYVEDAIFFAKDLRPRMTEVQIDDLLAEVISVVEPRMQRKGVQVVCHGSDAVFIVDSVLCQRILANIISNAIDASSGGQVVTLDTELDTTRGIMRFVIKDAGIGIPPENLSKVWQPYFTTKDAGDDNERGFGLGLALCQLLVELLQGAITLESTLGVGTTVTVELPRNGGGQPIWLPPHYAS